MMHLLPSQLPGRCPGAGSKKGAKSGTQLFFHIRGFAQAISRGMWLIQMIAAKPIISQGLGCGNVVKKTVCDVQKIGALRKLLHCI